MREYFESRGLQEDGRLSGLYQKGQVGRYVVGTDDQKYIASRGEFPAETSVIYVEEFSMIRPADMSKTNAGEFLATATSRQQAIDRGFRQHEKFTPDRRNMRIYTAQGAALTVSFMRLFQDPQPIRLFIEEERAS